MWETHRTFRRFTSDTIQIADRPFPLRLTFRTHRCGNSLSPCQILIFASVVQLAFDVSSLTALATTCDAKASNTTAKAMMRMGGFGTGLESPNTPAH